MPSLQSIGQERLDASFKGFPLEHQPFRVDQAAEQGLNLLRGDLPFPCAILRESAFLHNSRWFGAFARELDIDFAPHGKTSMAPQIFAQQLLDGAWGITVGTVQQAWIALDAGVERVLMANQIASAGEAQRWLSMMDRYPGARMLSLVDSQAQLDMLCEAVRAKASDCGAKMLAFDVLVELGQTGGRTGCRSIEEALALALEVRRRPELRLLGVEAYEGLAASGDSEQDRAMVYAWMQSLAELVRGVDDHQAWDADEIIVSAGGSSVFDLVASALTETRKRLKLSRPIRIVLRSGCYITHDDGTYRRLQQAMESRGLSQAVREGLALPCCESPWHRGWLQGAKRSGLIPAMEVWACVQSRPEPGLALVTMGRRDAGFDGGLPSPVLSYRSGRLSEAAAHWRLKAMNDQHGYLQVNEADDLGVGDLIGFGISHPCTTFDKWRLLWVIDHQYNVRSAIRTYF
ncbi:MAG: alanine racemase [Burkholderiales bacterium]